MAESHEVGRRGEALAATILQDNGWTILERNFRLGHKEIDLVARRDRIVAFIEVKSRTAGGLGHPLEAITRAKRDEIRRVASAWVARHGRRSDLYRFDAIAIVYQSGGAPPLVEHLEDAWRL
jgi:putative endonuclease